jgi:glycosyltransferase involved in cell wall biosynthesis
MKILINTANYIENSFIPNLTQGLVSQDVECIVLKPNSLNKQKIELIDEIKIINYRYFLKKYENFYKFGIRESISNSKFNYFKLLLLMISQFFNLIKVCIIEKPDFIYAHWFVPQGLISYLVGKFFKIKVVFTSHGSDVLVMSKVGKIGFLITKKIIKSFHRISVNSQLTLNQITKMFKENNQLTKDISIIPMPIEEIFFNYKIENSYSKNFSRSINFLYIGRLVEEKGLIILLESFFRFYSINNQAKLKIAGDGPLKTYIIDFIKSNNLSGVINLIGYVEREKKISTIENADVVIIPSMSFSNHIEGGPLTLIESMALSRITLVSDSVGFIDYCLDKKNCFVFKSNSKEDLFRKMVDISNLNLEEANLVSNNAKKIAKLFTKEKISKQIVDQLLVV